MTRNAMTAIVTGLSDKDLNALIAIANAESRTRLDKAHHAYVLQRGECPVHHFACAQMLAGAKAIGLR